MGNAVSREPPILPSQTAPNLGRLGVVVIGRNEGERLRRCLQSIDPSRWPVVYVDSGSSDDSVAAAHAAGAEVELLDSTLGFTAARARNLGWRRLLRMQSDVEFIQFVDGDCQVDGHWLLKAQAFMDENPIVAGVCGRRRERYPEASIYNSLCDIEWATPIGETLATGGDALFRAKALLDVGGFRDSLIAGEEPEMCLRMRSLGWSLVRLDLEMTRHDAAMTTIFQWWRRARRAGHAYAEGHYLHGHGPHFHYRNEVRRILFWTVGLPLVGVSASLIVGMWSFVLLLLYPLQYVRLWWRHRRMSAIPSRLASPLAMYFVLGRFAELHGLIGFYVSHLVGRSNKIIEYK